MIAESFDPLTARDHSGIPHYEFRQTQLVLTVAQYLIKPSLRDT